MTLRAAVPLLAAFALAACGGNDDVSTEAETDTVEVVADDTMGAVEAEPVADPAASVTRPAVSTPEPEETDVVEATVEEDGANAEDTAAAAMEAMETE